MNSGMKIRMKIGWVFVVLMITATNLFAQTQKPDPKFFVYLCFGQSNMEAGARPEKQDSGRVDSRFQMLAAVDNPKLGRTMGSWYVAEPPINRPENNMGPVDWFGRTMVANLPAEYRVGVINVSVAGAKIELWGRESYKTYLDSAETWMQNICRQYNGNPYQRLVDMAKIAQRDGVIKGILIHQGESNSSDPEWPEKVKAIYLNLMSDLSLNPKDVPLLAGELKSKEENGVCYRFNTDILPNLKKAVPNSHIVSSAGVKGQPDQFHFNTAGMRELGRRYGVKMLELHGFSYDEKRGPLPATAQSAVQPSPQSAAQSADKPLPKTSYEVVVNTDKEPVAPGKFQPDWESLSQYQVPEWYRNAKFGIWAHWGPQCQPGQGDWYARFMYNEGGREYRWHVANYGHPSKFGFKEVINAWKADKWDPERLVALYKRAGAQYFVAMANHHDNLDMWNSKYQEWNTVNVGPKQDVLAGWAKAAKRNGLPFGLSAHAAHAWSWMEVAQRADKNGPMAGVPYDGNLTKEEGKGTWWEGLDPQELYAQNHPLSQGSEDINRIHSQWGWENGVTIPSQAYCDKFYNRTVDMINQFKPDLLYFDDTALPLYPISDAGLKIAAHFYNSNMKQHKGKLEAVLLGKILTPEQKKALVWDVERGAPDRIQEEPWQTCTCIGDWHYNFSVYNDKRYKSAQSVIQSLIDVVSKNGNMLLSIPVRGDGSIDELEVAVLEGIAAWMEINGESIFDTRPWKVFGEGPAAEAANPINAQGFNEGRIKFSSKDIRFNQKGNLLFVTVMGPPTEPIQIKNLNNQLGIAKIEMLGSKEKVQWSQTPQHLQIAPPSSVPNPIAVVYKVTLR